MLKVAFLGLGRMGSPMAANIAKAGFPLFLYNRSSSKAVDLAQKTGATTMLTPSAVVRDADIVITMLSDEKSVHQVYEGPEGVLDSIKPGAIVIDMGTTGPEGVAWLAKEIERRGAHFLDSPVSGSTAAATSGTLTLMVGGEREVLEKARPVLESIGGLIYFLGASGSGMVMKLAVNGVIYALGQAVSESLVMAERAGISREAAYEVFENSAIAAPMVKYRHNAFIHPEDTPAAFAMTLAAKDLRLILKLAGEFGVQMKQAAVNLDVLNAAIEAGLGEKDMADVAVYLRNSANH
jgi:3-hydroxyisobutyrate dehydrogenase-like beta-hydroxyacid dehydrogenase